MPFSDDDILNEWTETTTYRGRATIASIGNRNRLFGFAVRHDGDTHIAYMRERYRQQQAEWAQQGLPLCRCGCGECVSTPASVYKRGHNMRRESTRG